MLPESIDGEIPVENAVVETQIISDQTLPYYRSQAEKYERLYNKSESAYAKLQADASKRDESLSAFTARVAEIEQSLEQERTLRFTELKKRVLSENRLDADLMEFLSGSDEEAVTAQAQKLAVKLSATHAELAETVVPNKQVLPRMGGMLPPNTGKPAHLSNTPSLLGGGFNLKT